MTSYTPVMKDGNPGEGSSTQQAYRSLRQLILTGVLQPGEKLKIDALKERLAVGASPIREALSLLTSDYLVDRVDQRGFRVAETSQENFNEILSLRCTLEAQALRDSIANFNADWEERLVVTHHRMQRAKAAGDASFEQHHKDFHLELIGNAGSRIMMSFCAMLYDLNVRYRYLAGSSLDYPKRDVDEEHQQILDAVWAKDADLACERLLAHYRTTGGFLSRALSQDTDRNAGEAGGGQSATG